jgi:hypothetical protein
LDKFARNKDAIAGGVDTGASRLPDVAAFGGLYFDADLFQHIQRGVVTANHISVLQRAIPAAAGSRGNDCRRRPFPH